MTADRALHFGVGMTVGLLLAVPSLLRAWHRGDRLFSVFRRLAIVSCGLGLFAVVPNILHRAGCSYEFCSGWWMNIFVLHHLLGRLRPGGGALIGQALIVVCFSLEYALMFTALLGQRYRNLDVSVAG